MEKGTEIFILSKVIGDSWGWGSVSPASYLLYIGAEWPSEVSDRKTKVNNSSTEL